MFCTNILTQCKSNWMSTSLDNDASLDNDIKILDRLKTEKLKVLQRCVDVKSDI